MTYRKDSPSTIQSMFNSIAHRYDTANTVLSFSLHRLWNRSLVRLIRKQAPAESVLLDLCSGTGDIAFEYLKNAPKKCEVFLIDFSSEMLEQAKRKEKQNALFQIHKLHYIVADVQRLPLPDQSADCATMAYGIRNVQNPSLCFQEVSRVLKPGGCFGILELTRPRSSLLRWGHRLYLKTILPFMGKRLTNNEQAYQYLCGSIESFTEPEALAQSLRENGFRSTQTIPLAGGIATLLVAIK